ncbi:hypothetical protein QC764_608580 [Podospora pseudoanserina]|uniref:Uncharacterized protein n=1 Tax=Podospora pseudoanserina TaxID=2609844 RepID=A0ABR0HV60_9PEZI|nr:hypothetical protein QC764_608580 [Podospora pseudoanserina]
MARATQWHATIAIYIFFLPTIFLHLHIRMSSEFDPHSLQHSSSEEEAIEKWNPRPIVSDPSHCAELYNLLLSRYIAAIPSEFHSQTHPPTTTALETTLFPRFSTLHPAFFSNMEDPHSHPFHILLSQLQTSSPFQRDAILSPFFIQPEPDLLVPSEAYHSLFQIDFEEALEQQGRCLLLFLPGNMDFTGEPPYDEGLVLDADTLEATWRHGMDGLPEYPGPSWIPLHVVLEKEREKWERGEYYFDEEQMKVEQRGWTEIGLDETVQAWEGLLKAIEDKGGTGGEWDEPLRLEDEDIERYKVSRFAKEFLSRSKRPKFKFIGPGITVFSPESWLEVYGSEPENSERRLNRNGAEYKNWPTLVFPSAYQVGSPFHQWSPGYYKAALSEMVHRRTGVYLNGWDHRYAEAAELVSGSADVPRGITSFDRPPPWGPVRGTRLALILRHWTTLVEDGTWEVGVDGVAEHLTWWNDDNKVKAQVRRV